MDCLILFTIELTPYNTVLLDKLIVEYVIEGFRRGRTVA
jgi:hypothetical protein